MSGALLALSGLVLAAFRYVVPVDNPFSVYPHGGWQPAVAVHVLAAPPFFFYVGSIWWHHVVRHWNNRRRRASGGTVIAATAIVAGTGYALYFTGAEPLLRAVRLAHAAGGVLGIVCYAFHAILGWRALRAAETDAEQNGQPSASVLS